MMKKYITIFLLLSTQVYAQPSNDASGVIYGTFKGASTGCILLEKGLRACETPISPHVTLPAPITDSWTGKSATKDLVIYTFDRQLIKLNQVQNCEKLLQQLDPYIVKGKCFN